MENSQQFQQAITAGNPSGEVVAVNRYLVTVEGLQGCAVNGMVMFENGAIGIIREVSRGVALVLNCDSEQTKIGSLVVLRDPVFSVGVGEGLLGRVVDPFGRPLDGKAAPRVTAMRPVFSPAFSIVDRAMLSEQLPTGVTVVDSLFPIVRGQRIAILGDAKSGKTTFSLQLAAQQAKSETVLVYVLIGKRRMEVNQLVADLTNAGVMDQAIVVVADIAESLASSYIAPYTACAMAEQIWIGGRDTVIVYDDLSSHAKVYREISLLADANPGRDSYPGDMFYAHSSLLERAGKLKQSGKTLTALPIVTTPGDDITAYLPTSIMSITDGQLIFDLTMFRKSIRPALNIGLSVSRVGGRAQTKQQKKLTIQVLKRLASFRQAEEFSHFGSDMSDESRQTLFVGQQLQEVFRQLPEERFARIEQQLLIEALLNESAGVLDIQRAKEAVKECAKGVKEADTPPYENALKKLISESQMTRAMDAARQ